MAKSGGLCSALPVMDPEVQIGKGGVTEKSVGENGDEYDEGDVCDDRDACHDAAAESPGPRIC